MKIRKIKQKARIILNSDDAVRTLNQNHIIPVRDAPITFDGALGNNVDVTSDRIHYIDHRFADNEAVIYTAATVMTATPTLTTAMTLYVKRVNDNIFQLSTTSGGAAINITATNSATQTLTRSITFNGSSNTVVIEATNTIILASHGLTQGTPVKYEAADAASQIQGLVHTREYYVIKIDEDTIQLANSFQDATFTMPDGTLNPKEVNISGVGVGTNHYIRKIISFEISASPVVDLVNERINIPAHPYQTGDMVLYQVDSSGYAAGTAIGGLVDNMYYFVIATDTDSIRLADTKTNATATPPTAINLSTVGTGNNHSFTRVSLSPDVCTNYKFKLDKLPFDLNEKCRLSVQSFDYVKSYGTTNCKSVGGVYLKSIVPADTYSTQGFSRGSLLLPAYFGDTLSYQNSDLEYNSIPVPQNFGNILQNGLDIFVDSKKRNFGNQDIYGNINEDSFNLSLIIYELEDFEYQYQDMSEKQRNYVNIAMS